VSDCCPPNLRETVTVSMQSEVIDPAGQITTTWAPLATVRARMRPMKAYEVSRAGRSEGATMFEATIRYRTDVNASCRLTWGTRVFDVQGVENRDEERRFLTLTLLERERLVAQSSAGTLDFSFADNSALVAVISF
jgi:SPP1 family predicted phage head-tail adaptor